MLTDLPNIGEAGAQDLRLLGIHQPSQLVGKCPFEMYEALCAKTSTRHDPCAIDVFISITRFMGGRHKAQSGSEPVPSELTPLAPSAATNPACKGL